MQTKSDAQLLREYAEQASDAAFGEIVARHADLVYSAASRQLGSPDLAHEVTQSVFTDLARKARSLTNSLSVDASLAGWLYRGTRYAGLTLLRDERRRQAHERTVMEQFNPASERSTDWECIGPVLDEAMAELGDADRDAVLLRFFKNHDFRAVGRALGVSDDAAQKRVSRAVERLREFLAKRGVTIGASGLVLAISTNAIQAAPAGLAQCTTVAAIAKGTVAGASSLTLIKGALKIMVSHKLKTMAVAVVLILLATVTAEVALKVFRTSSKSSPPNLQGAWEGSMELAGVAGVLRGESARTRVVFRFFETNGAPGVTVDVIDTTPARFQVTNLAYDYPSLRIDAGQNGSFEGKLIEGGAEISGTIHAGNLLAPLSLKRTMAPSIAPVPLGKNDYVRRTGSDLQGRWEGILGNGRGSVQVVVRIAEPELGRFRAEVDNVTGPWMGQPMSVTYDHENVRLVVSSRAGMFQGTINNDGSEMVGQWVQGGNRVPATLRRADQ